MIQTVGLSDDLSVRLVHFVLDKSHKRNHSICYNTVAHIETLYANIRKSRGYVRLAGGYILHYSPAVILYEHYNTS